MSRYVLPVATLEIGARAVELFVGIDSHEPLDPLEWDGLIPADGMTDDELAVVTRWIEV